jgi:serine/threonine protein phosphatase PrpC
MRSMADPMVLYVVTSIVIAGLAIWVVLVLATAKDAVPMISLPAVAPPDVEAKLPAGTKQGKNKKNRKREAGKETENRAKEPKEENAKEKEKKKEREPEEAQEGEASPESGRSKSPSPSITNLAEDEPPVSSSALVVALPRMRQRLDSHPEIDDGAAPAPEPYQAPDSVPPSASPLSLVSAMGRTDPATRKGNEDAFAIIDRHHLFVVADATGGATPDLASQLTVDIVAGTFDEEDPKPTIDVRGLSRRANRVRRAVLAANRKLRERTIAAASSAPTRVSVAVVHFSPDNQRVHVAHVGGARCYRVRHGSIEWLRSNPEEVPSDRLGVNDSIEVDVLVETPQPGDVYLICSDGLCHALGEDELLASVEGATTLEGATTRLVDRAKAKGEREDITGIVVRVDTPTS